MAASVFNSIQKEVAKHQAWAAKIYAVVGSEKFRQIPLYIELGISSGHLEKVMTALKELGMVRKIGRNSGTWWQLRKKMCHIAEKERNNVGELL